MLSCQRILTSFAHSTPLRPFRGLPKVSTNAGEAQLNARSVRRTRIIARVATAKSGGRTRSAVKAARRQHRRSAHAGCWRTRRSGRSPGRVPGCVPVRCIPARPRHRTRNQRQRRDPLHLPGNGRLRRGDPYRGRRDPLRRHRRGWAAQYVASLAAASHLVPLRPSLRAMPGSSPARRPAVPTGRQRQRGPATPAAKPPRPA